MGWLIIVALLYLPIIYRIHRRLDKLEEENRQLREELGARR